MTITDHHRCVVRAQRALAQLESNPATSRAQLGAARDQLNIVQNRVDPQAVQQALEVLEDLVARTGSAPDPCSR